MTNINNKLFEIIHPMKEVLNYNKKFMFEAISKRNGIDCH